MNILFLHGWQSTPGGVKPTYLKNHGHEVLNPALPDDDFDAAVRIAQAEFDQHHPDVVVGSSRGGAVAMNINIGDTPCVLPCSLSESITGWPMPSRRTPLLAVAGGYCWPGQWAAMLSAGTISNIPLGSRLPR
jgi:hypothetical protein